MNNDLNNDIGSENSQLSNNQPIQPINNEASTMQPNPIPNSNEIKQPVVNNNLNSNEVMEQPINNQISKPELSNQSEFQNSSPQLQNKQLPDNDTKYQYSNNKELSNPKNSKSKFHLAKYGIAIGVIVICIVGLLIGIKIFKNKKNNSNLEMSLTEKLKSSSSFFLYNDEEKKYALFTDDGRKLTDFIFDKTTDFFNGTAYVEKDEQDAVIDSSGQEIINSDKYKFISYPRAGLYKVSDSELNDYIINSKGKVVYTFNEKYGNSLNDFTTTDLYAYAIDGEKIILFNYEGKKLKEYKMREEANRQLFRTDPLYDYYGDIDTYFSIYYDGDLTIYRNSDFSVVYNGKIDYPYILFRAEYDKIFYLYPLHYYDSDTGENRKKLMLMNNKLEEIDYELYDKKIRPDGSFGTGDYYMDIAKNNYVISPNSSHRYVEYYVNGNLVKKIEDQSISADGQNGVYRVKLSNEDFSLTWYNENGDRVLSESYAALGLPDSNDRAIAQKKDMGQYILIDKSGKQIGNAYDYISEQKGYYIIHQDNLIGVMDKDGKELIPCIYKNYNIYSYANKDYILFTTSEEKFKLYSLGANKEIATFNIKPNFRDHYLEIHDSDSGTTKYYTYNGIMIHES